MMKQLIVKMILVMWVAVYVNLGLSSMAQSEGIFNQRIDIARDDNGKVIVYERCITEVDFYKKFHGHYIPHTDQVVLSGKPSKKYGILKRQEPEKAKEIGKTLLKEMRVNYRLRKYFGVNVHPSSAKEFDGDIVLDNAVVKRCNKRTIDHCKESPRHCPPPFDICDKKPELDSCNLRKDLACELYEVCF